MHERQQDVEDPVHTNSRFVYNGFIVAGPIPEALGALTNLRGLYLQKKQLTGTPMAFVCAHLLRVPPRYLEHDIAYWLPTRLAGECVGLRSY